ncbi:phosphonate ABC transporter ATPase [Erysipelotrichaceae bacterium]|nr:phosphonate ABC transporter ATPase [Erysipelotrichaceae bacterium]
MEPLLQMSGIQMVYNHKSVGLEHIDLTVKKGEFIVIIGPSGAGKSTLLRCINLLVLPTGGKISFLDKRDIQELSGNKLRQLRGQIGMIFQNYNLISRASVLENVLHGRLGHINPIRGLFGLYSKEDRAYAISLLEHIGLGDHMYKRADELSGGQMQRVGICRALCQNPQLMLADEPIASLDPKSASDVMNALYDNCHEKGITCIANLHQVDVAKKYATRIIGVRKGRIVFDGPPDTLTPEIISKLYKGKEENEDDAVYTAV